MIFKAGISLRAILVPLLTVFAMWIAYLFQIHNYFSNCWGAIIPLVPEGLKGVFFSPFLHGSWDHLIGNSLPMAILLFMLYQFYPFIANKIFIWGWSLVGFLVWLLPPIDIFSGEYHYTCIIGASGIVYVLAFFLFFSGVFRWNMKLLTVSMVVAFYYGSLIWGVFPEEFFSNLTEPSKISWQSHLSGAFVGVLLAFFFRKVGEKKKKFIWEFPNYYSEKDDRLWQEYKEKNPEHFLELPQKKKDDVWDHLEEIRKNNV